MMSWGSHERKRSSRAWLILLLPALLLTSCAMGPDYVRPHIETAEKFRMAETEGQSIANLPWWELLRDEELQRLIRQALMENKDLKQAVASVEELQARLATTRFDFFFPRWKRTLMRLRSAPWGAFRSRDSPRLSIILARARSIGRSISGAESGAQVKLFAPS